MAKKTMLRTQMLGSFIITPAANHNIELKVKIKNAYLLNSILKDRRQAPKTVTAVADHFIISSLLKLGQRIYYTLWRDRISNKLHCKGSTPLA